MITIFGIQVNKLRDLLHHIFNPTIVITDDDSLDWEVTDPNSTSDRHRSMLSVMKHGKRIGKQLINDNSKLLRELRYTRFELQIIKNKNWYYGVKTIISIPIPFMKQDHFIRIG